MFYATWSFTSYNLCIFDSQHGLLNFLNDYFPHLKWMFTLMWVWWWAACSLTQVNISRMRDNPSFAKDYIQSCPLQQRGFVLYKGGLSNRKKYINIKMFSFFKTRYQIILQCNVCLESRAKHQSSKPKNLRTPCNL